MLTFSDIHRAESDEWSQEGQKLTDPQTLEQLQTMIDKGRILVAEHWHYRGARAPDRLVIEYYDDFVEYLEKNAIAGDIVDIFDISDAWREKGEPVISGKCPDERREIPKRGAY